MRAISRTIIAAITFLVAGDVLLAITPAISAEPKPPAQVLFTNVNIFDGKSDTLAMGMSILVEGNKIKKIARGNIESAADATVIDGRGCTLIPGLIDTHQHIMIAEAGPTDYKSKIDPNMNDSISQEQTSPGHLLSL